MFIYAANVVTFEGPVSQKARASEIGIYNSVVIQFTESRVSEDLPTVLASELITFQEELKSTLPQVWATRIITFREEIKGKPQVYSSALINFRATLAAPKIASSARIWVKGPGTKPGIISTANFTFKGFTLVGAPKILSGIQLSMYAAGVKKAAVLKSLQIHFKDYIYQPAKVWTRGFIGFKANLHIDTWIESWEEIKFTTLTEDPTYIQTFKKDFVPEQSTSEKEEEIPVSSLVSFNASKTTGSSAWIYKVR